MDIVPLFKVFMSETSIRLAEKTLRSGYVGQGPMVEKFEEALRQIERVDRVLATTSATHALDLAYHLCGIGPGSKVISTPMTCTATNTQLVVRGAEILWADVSPLSGLIDPEIVSRLVSDHPDVRAIVAVDWAGRVAGYESLKSHGVPVIEDGAHSFLAFGREGFGDYRIWSFQAIKHVTCGDGGALSAPSDAKHERADLLRWYGLDRNKSSDFRCRQDISEAGYKYGMNDVAASIGLGNLYSSLWIVDRHRMNALKLCDALKGHKEIRCLPFDEGCSYWVFPILTRDEDARRDLSVYLRSAGFISSEVHSRNDTKTCFSGSIRELRGLMSFSSRQLNIPCGWWMGPKDIDRLCEELVKFK